MGLTSLSSALSGLAVSQRQIETISTNVANVGTEGYTRKILPQNTQTVEGRAVGALAGRITRNVDLNLSRSLWTQVSSVGFYDVQEAYLSRIEQFHGAPDQEISVAAEIGRLKDSFAALSDSPSDPFQLSSTVDQAVDTAGKFNELGQLITTLRNDVQDELEITVTRINDLLEQVALLNQQISTQNNLNRTTAESEDARDRAVKELSGLIEISFFSKGDATLVIQTNEGVELVGNNATPLTFDPVTLSNTIFYPDSAAAVYVGDESNASAVDLTARSPGGKLGGLIELRDTIFPKQQAQLDELAHKMALRFEAQGLTLFTDANGVVPSDANPNLSTTPETPVNYVGFASVMRVNSEVLADNTLLQTGTNGTSIQTGSNEVIRRVIDFTFGEIDYQRAIGTIDLDISGYGSPNNTLQGFLGVTSSNSITGYRDLSSFANATDFVNSTNGAISGTSNTFRLTFEEPDLSLGPVDIDIDLSSVADGAGTFPQDIVDYITGTLIPALGAGDQADLTAMGVGFSVSSDGELAITSTGDITVDGTNPANPMGSTGLELLGLAEQTVEATDPYFDIAVGNDDFTRITIAPDEDHDDLLTKLQAVPGLAAQYNATTNVLEIRPGEDFSDPTFGGDLRILSGPFTASSAGANAEIAAGTIPDGVNLVSALFGSFDAGPPQQNLSPIEDVRYGSQISNSNTNNLAFREDFLGPGANISTNIVGVLSLSDFAQKMINEQAQAKNLVSERREDDNALRDLLEDQILSESGVNIDEELGNLIVVQTAYAAAARVINAVDELFQELLNAI
jgi:flagellar hook-associated protein 1 FlgK